MKAAISLDGRVLDASGDRDLVDADHDLGVCSWIFCEIQGISQKELILISFPAFR